MSVARMICRSCGHSIENDGAPGPVKLRLEDSDTALAIVLCTGCGGCAKCHAKPCYCEQLKQDAAIRRASLACYHDGGVIDGVCRLCGSKVA